MDRNARLKYLQGRLDRGLPLEAEEVQELRQLMGLHSLGCGCSKCSREIVTVTPIPAVPAETAPPEVRLADAADDAATALVRYQHAVRTARLAMAPPVVFVAMTIAGSFYHDGLLWVGAILLALYTVAAGVFFLGPPDVTGLHTPSTAFRDLRAAEAKFNRLQRRLPEES